MRLFILYIISTSVLGYSSDHPQGRVKGGGTPGTMPGGPLRIWGPSFCKAHF